MSRDHVPLHALIHPEHVYIGCLTFAQLPLRRAFPSVTESRDDVRRHNTPEKGLGFYQQLIRDIESDNQVRVCDARASDCLCEVMHILALAALVVHLVYMMLHIHRKSPDIVIAPYVLAA